jgi:hypothetical protein
MCVAKKCHLKKWVSKASLSFLSGSLIKKNKNQVKEIYSDESFEKNKLSSITQ